jgi:hypothetical protein
MVFMAYHPYSVLTARLLKSYWNKYGGIAGGFWSYLVKSAIDPGLVLQALIDIRPPAPELRTPGRPPPSDRFQEPTQIRRENSSAQACVSLELLLKKMGALRSPFGAACQVKSSSLNDC